MYLSPSALGLLSKQYKRETEHSIVVEANEDWNKVSVLSD